MTSLRRMLVFLLALFMTGFYFGPRVTATFFQVGGADDPLVTKSWVDDYVQGAFLPTEKKISDLEEKTARLKEKAAGLRPLVRILLTAGARQALINEQTVTLDEAPFLVSGRILLPLRFIGEAFGTDFVWNEGEKRVSYQTAAGWVTLTLGDPAVKVGPSWVHLDVPAAIRKGRVFVPLRFIGETMDRQVRWYQEKKQVEIN